MRISDWSSDVCSSDLTLCGRGRRAHSCQSHLYNGPDHRFMVARSRWPREHYCLCACRRRIPVGNSPVDLAVVLDEEIGLSPDFAPTHANSSGSGVGADHPACHFWRGNLSTEPTRRYFFRYPPATGIIDPFGHGRPLEPDRSEEHTSELQSLMRISYAVFCLKKKKIKQSKAKTAMTDTPEQHKYNRKKC